MSQNFIERVFKDVIEDLTADENVIAKYFSPSYIQYVDGETLDYKQFIDHMKYQKSILSSVKVSIESCCCEENKICTAHIVDAMKKNGDRVSIKVIAIFETKEGKIVLCDELTHLIKGAPEDQNIGSMRSETNV